MAGESDEPREEEPNLAPQGPDLEEAPEDDPEPVFDGGPAEATVTGEDAPIAWEDRYRALDIPRPAENRGRWRCLSPCCIHKGPWWMSSHGVVNCLNCCPPAFPWLAIARGGEGDAPTVEADRSSQAVPASRDRYRCR